MPMASTDRELRVLHLEDSELDHELMVVHLMRGGLRVRALRIDSEGDFIAALEQPWDAIVSDYNLPGFSGLVALDLLAASARDVPFILVSGEIGEDTAVAAMRNGASDYLLKNNLARLVGCDLARDVGEEIPLQLTDTLDIGDYSIELSAAIQQALGLSLARPRVELD